MIDIRDSAAKYYDSQPDPFAGNDIRFYLSQIPSADSTILEIGCGTGRVTIPLSQKCKAILGIDISKSMIDIFNKKLIENRNTTGRVKAEIHDACEFRTDEKYDLIIAPFRVFQNIEDDESISRFFDTIRYHLKNNGRCILNVFQPFAVDDLAVRTKWESTKDNKKMWEMDIQGVKIICYDKISKIHPDKLICYPTLTYEVVKDGRIIDKTELNIAMRCYFPKQFIDIIEANGFEIEDKWGGYLSEIYGEGSELVVKFKKR